MKTIKLILGLTIAMLVFSCNKDENQSSITSKEVSMNVKIDQASDDVSRIVEDQLTASDGISGKFSDISNELLPNCATVTRVPDFGASITPGTLITKTIDFGTIGCPLPNGNILKGIIIITFTYQPDATSHTITYTFNNFYHNAVKFDGTKTFTRVLTTTAANPNTHPVVTMNIDMTATFPNGEIVTRVGTRVREIIEGYNTPQLEDNIYEVTGNWITTFPNGVSQTSTISQPLRIRLNCSNIVSGIVTIVRNDVTATLNYGNGECDNLAVFTINGNSVTIILGN